MALSVQTTISVVVTPVTTPVIHGVPVAAITLVAAPIASISLT